MQNTPNLAAKAPRLIHGADISQYQGTINWDVFSRKVQFVFIRAVSGVRPDSTLEYNVREARRTGVPYGLYYVPVWSADWQKQAAVHIQVEKALGGQLPPVMDLERHYSLSPAELGQIVVKWMVLVEKGVQKEMMIYTGPGFYNPRIVDTNVLWRRKLWVAHWDVPRPTLPEEWRKRGQTWILWQYSADQNRKASEYGVPPPPEADPDLDLNHFNGDAAAFEAAFGIKPKPFPLEIPAGVYGRVRTLRETRLYTLPEARNENQAGILHANHEFEVAGEEQNGFIPVKAYLPKDRLAKTD
jgi:GH25 family lysozyme M1 (1,4-beta-N-acetylmuramidase)